MKKSVSIVIPCYRSEKTIEGVVLSIKEVMDKFDEYNYEFVLVNDCSPDSTEQVIFDMALKYKNIEAYSLAKNQGQHAAVMAGFNQASGEYVLTVADDGQSPVERIPDMFEKIKEGYDVVCGNYVERSKRSIFRRVGSIMDTITSAWLTGTPGGVRVTEFSLYKKFVVDEMIKYKQPYPYIESLVIRVTRNITGIDMEQKERKEGTSGYNFRKLLELWINEATMSSLKPLRVVTVGGMALSIVGFCFSIIVIVRKLIDSGIQSGWSSIIACIMIIGGLLLFVLGVIGEYIGRIYLCINNTPQYVIRNSSIEMDSYGKDKKPEH